MEEIGRGSFATVYKAVHVVCSRPDTEACLRRYVLQRVPHLMLQTTQFCSSLMDSCIFQKTC